MSKFLNSSDGFPKVNIFSVFTYLIFLKRGLKLPVKQIVHHISLSHSPSHVSPFKSSQI